MEMEGERKRKVKQYKIRNQWGRDILGIIKCYIRFKEEGNTKLYSSLVTSLPIPNNRQCHPHFFSTILLMPALNSSFGPSNVYGFKLTSKQLRNQTDERVCYDRHCGNYYFKGNTKIKYVEMVKEEMVACNSSELVMFYSRMTIFMHAAADLKSLVKCLY